MNEERAKYDAKIFHDAIKGAGKKDLLQDEKIIMILATRSKSHIKALYKYYKEFNGKDLDEVILELYALFNMIKHFLRKK